jgi:sugar phosphate isomerase/epimerase
MYSRRDFAKIALAGVPLSMALAKINSTIRGVQLGVQSYSFRDLPLDGAIAAMKEIGLGDCELFSPHVEPRVDREALRKWRISTSFDEFRAVRQKFDDAGVGLYAYNLSFRDDFTDQERERGFEQARALGVNVITASSTLTEAKRLVPFAEKFKMTVAFHGHSDNKHPNEFSSPESFGEALAMSKRFAVNLDIGHFTAAGYDPVEYIQAHHDRIVVLHLKDRKKDQGPNVPWGQGDTPIKPVLQLLRDKKYPIRAFIEYEYKGTGTSAEEVKKCFEYCKEALA